MDHFPQALASGYAFCNRKNETERLKFNLIESRPTLSVSSRRYGKTSLALHTIKQEKLHYAQFDFLSAVCIDDIEKIILRGMGQLLERIEKGPRKALKLATDIFSGLSIKLSSDVIGLSVEINKRSNSMATHILSILERAEKLSIKYNIKIVLLFDEFQRVFQVSEDQSIESIIRQVAQESKNLSFIFSGSNRYLLDKVFSDRNRPLYKLCDRFNLERISSHHYLKYIYRVAKKTDRHIDEDAIEKVFHYTERHPYYMNLLCSRLWILKVIKVDDVDRAWAAYAFEERSSVANELDLLSNSQRKLLAALARSNGTNEPRGRDFKVKANMPGATIAQALTVLEKKDFVFKDSQGIYKILDPVMKYILYEN